MKNTDCRASINQRSIMTRKQENIMAGIRRPGIKEIGDQGEMTAMWQSNESGHDDY